MDARLWEHVHKKHDPHEKYLGLLPSGFGWLFAEFGGDDEGRGARRRPSDCGRASRGCRTRRAVKVVTDAAEQQHIWLVRESGLGATAFVPGEPDAWEGWEDSAVAPQDIGALPAGSRALLWERYGYDSAMYGHFGMGCVHCRIDFDLRERSVASRSGVRYMDEATDLVAIKYRGSLSGEHGDGQSQGRVPSQDVRARAGRRRSASSRRSGIPTAKMNPGKIVDPLPDRREPAPRPRTTPRGQSATHFAYPDDGGSFAHATLRCVGVGKCRRMSGEGDEDTMCPSLHGDARGEALHARPRPPALRDAAEGDPLDDGLARRAVKEALDLCLACKGCKGDCPVNVDMATYKAEFLSHY